jgi:hypothetical protein
MRLLVTAAPIALSACAASATSAAGPAADVQVQLVDSVAWEHELGDGFLRRVEVRHAGRSDTLPGLLVFAPPVLAGDRLFGFEYHQDAVVAGFRYDVRRRRLRRFPLPDDINPVFSEPSLSPDGRHVAYVSVPGDATGWAVVRTWPAGRLRVRSDRVQVPATDSPGGNGSRWISPDTAEVFIETGFATESGWYRVLASVSERRVLEADTVRTTPWMPQPVRP